MSRSIWMRSLISFSLLALSSWASLAHAINYDDPNLSDRRDVVARAALNCNSFRGAREQFDACLVSQGVTDLSEKSEAASIAKAVPPQSGPSLSDSNGRQRPLPFFGTKSTK